MVWVLKCAELLDDVILGRSEEPGKEGAGEGARGLWVGTGMRDILNAFQMEKC